MPERYSPIQPTSDHEHPTKETFPPVHIRVPQNVDPFCDVEDLEIPRVTYQGNELCNLKCPGCYANEWLLRDGVFRMRNGSTKVDLETYEDHLDAIGPQLEEVYALGAELTAAPDHSREIIRRAAERDLAVMAITNGARRPEVVDRTLLEGLESGAIYKLNISLDSIDPDTNDALRGRQGACEATLETIRRYTERNFPIRLQMTVWPKNYGTILESVEKLYEEYGVRGFSFHCGSLEGVGDRQQQLEEVGGDCLDPLAWRVLTERLFEFNDTHYDDLQYFYVPFIYFTEEELREYVIGEPTLMDEFLAHTQALEHGESKPLPFNACPGIGVPQVYLYASDIGQNGVGKISACNMDTGAHDRYIAEYDEDQKRFITVQDPDKNQIQGMIDSPHLCPAMKAVTGNKNRSGSDRFETGEGDLFHGCRYISNNQMPAGSKKFPREIYEQYVLEYGRKFQ
jgi:pyruvate-formate lyase-activating enzyme